MIGSTLNSRYLVSTRIGKGAMGTVYRATDTQTGIEVALKVIARELAFDADMLERFRREGEALRQLRHPNIVGFVDAFQHEEQYILVMEYVPGGSLLNLIKQGALPIERAQRTALELCDALTRAHHLNIIHRDLKPENILIADDGTPKLTDFGVARLVTEGNRLTGTGTQIGTPYYMAPEAWEGKPLDQQADIWSLGVVFYEMLSGEVPFTGETLVAVMNKVLTAPLPDIKSKRPEVPDGLAQIVARMLTRDKPVRYRSMRELAADLERGGLATAPAVPTVPAFAPPTEKVPTEMPTRPGPRLSGRALGLAGLGIAIGVLLIGGLLFIPQFLPVQSPTSESTRPPATPAATSDPAAEAASATGMPSAVSVSAGLGQVLFEDDFESGSLLQWSNVQATFKVEQVDGQSVLHGAGTRDGNFASQNLEAADYAVQADFKFLKEAKQGEHHIQFYTRWSSDCPDNSGGSQSYTVDVLSDRVVLVKGICEKTGWINLIEVDHVIDPAAWHSIVFTVFGNRVQFTLDGALLIDYTDSEPLPGGGFALATNDGGEALFDNVRVSEVLSRPACGPDETELFYDDFEDGNVDDWYFMTERGVASGDWLIERQDGRQVLVGNGHNWATYGSLTWGDYALHLRLKRMEGNNSKVNVNIRNTGQKRYFLNYPGGELTKDNNPVSANERLTSVNFTADDDWHILTFVVTGGHIEISLDGTLLGTYDDAQPLSSGSIGIENINGTLWYDEVLVCEIPQPETADAATAVPGSPEAVNAALADPWGTLAIEPGELILLGAAPDLSGACASIGPDQRDAVQLAIDEFGPVAGFGVSPLAVDAPGPDGGEPAAQELLTHSPAAVVGTSCSGPMAAALPIFDAAHLVVVSPSASRNDLSQQGYAIFNRLVLADAINPNGEPLSDPSSPAYQEFAQKFTARFDRECCTPFAAEAYDAAMILLKSIEAVAVLDENGQLLIPRQALAQAVRATQNYAGLSGLITFDANGDRATTP